MIKYRASIPGRIEIKERMSRNLGLLEAMQH